MTTALRIAPLLLAASLAAGTMAPSLAATPEVAATQVAGPQPAEAAARQAVIDQIKRTVRTPADMLRVRFMSGPHLITAINFADNREQAWQMCVIQGDANIAHRSPDVEVKQYFLRTRGSSVAVVGQSNWKTYDNKC